MYRWNSRGYNTKDTRNRSNLYDESTSSRSSATTLSANNVISARLFWIWNAFKEFFSSILPNNRRCYHDHFFRLTLRKVNPINCLFSIHHLCLPLFQKSYHQEEEGSISNDSSSSCKSSPINNCNISGIDINPPLPPPPTPSRPRLKKMTQILSKTMTLLGVAFLIHFIIMSTFAEREGYTYSHTHKFGPDSHHHYIRRSQRSFRNGKHEGNNNGGANEEGGSLSPRPPQNKSDALFFTENSTIIIAQIGSKTYLPCAVRNLGSGVASWIRRRDYTLLTVGMGTYSVDERFWVAHNRAAQSWELHIKSVRESDEGVYECQISTHPPSSIFIHLSVVEAKAEILGEPDKHVRSGSTFELVCVLRDSTEPPIYVFWFHNDKMINYDVVRGVVVNSDAEKSILTIQDAQKTDSGNYSCVPSNARPTSISVHILNGEKPAAMQHGSRNGGRRPAPFSLALLLATTFTVFLMTAWLITTNGNLLSSRNLGHVQLNSFPTDPNGNEDTKDIDIGDNVGPEVVLQLVEISPKKVGITMEHKSLSHSLLKRLTHLTGLLQDAESACADKDDIRLEEAFRKEERSCLILSTSRVYISQIPYHHHHHRRHNSNKVSRNNNLSLSSRNIAPDGGSSDELSWEKVKERSPHLCDPAFSSSQASMEDLVLATSSSLLQKSPMTMSSQLQHPHLLPSSSSSTFKFRHGEKLSSSSSSYESDFFNHVAFVPLKSR